jgi:glutamate dehydrogenase (NADP+)
MYDVKELIRKVEARNPGEPEFVQAVTEVLGSVVNLVNGRTDYRQAKVIERLTEPDRVVSFKVEWEDDAGQVQVNRGYRVQFNNLLGPYKGGLRFHANVTVGALKFLAFEQTFKNALTMLPMGGGKGGSDFSPRGKSDGEIRRFCRAFMMELHKYIGPETDVPAGDIGVGGREIGYLFGQYKKLRGEHVGVLTGKGIGWGGSLVRPEATGFGSVYFAEEMLQHKSDSVAGKTVTLSGFGNVSWGVATKATQLGARVITISGPDGYVLDEEGVGTKEKWDYMLHLRHTNNDVVAPYAKKFNAKFFPGRRPWEVKAHIAFPCAIQNELDLADAQRIVDNGYRYVIETSNMGCTLDAIAHLQSAGIGFAPGKAANAGGVAVSGLEMSQNSMKLNWSREEVDLKLRQIMLNIHAMAVAHGSTNTGEVDYVLGANRAAFIRVADAMLDQGF